MARSIALRLRAANSHVSPTNGVARVQFFDGTTLLGTVTSSPFTMGARNAQAGVHYLLTAKATSVSGATATSAPIQITVRQRTDE